MAWPSQRGGGSRRQRRCSGWISQVVREDEDAVDVGWAVAGREGKRSYVVQAVG